MDCAVSPYQELNRISAFSRCFYKAIQRLYYELMKPHEKINCIESEPPGGIEDFFNMTMNNDILP